MFTKLNSKKCYLNLVLQPLYFEMDVMFVKVTKNAILFLFEN